MNVYSGSAIPAFMSHVTIDRMKAERNFMSMKLNYVAGMLFSRQL
jgi:hypothetical protein